MNRTQTIRFICLLAVILEAAPVAFSVESTVWVEFEDGKRLFRQKEFGQALNAFHSAVVERRGMFEKASKSLAAAMETPQAKRARGSILKLIDEFASENFLATELEHIEQQAGASLRKKIDLLSQRRLSDRFRGYLDAISRTLDYRSFEELDDSLDKLSATIASLSTYPEAEYWMGKVFQAEGELKLAEIQYQRAWDMREAYEIADERYTAVYALADLYRIYGDYTRMEDQYLLIVRDDPIASDSKNEFLRNAMVTTLTRDGFDKFMSLYRTEGDFAVDAYDALGSFWYDSGRQGKAVLYLGLATNRILTKAIEAIRAEEPSYAYTDLSRILKDISARPDLREYARSEELYRLLFTLSDALYANGARQSARGIWRTLAAQSEGGEWAARSAGQLKNPVVKTPRLK